MPSDTRDREAGITILEILVVLSIIALIAAVVSPRLIGYLGKAKSETAALQIDQLKNAVHHFYIDTGRYPTQAEGLAVLVSKPSGSSRWDGPYVETPDALKDPWTRDYALTVGDNPEDFFVSTLGRDGARGGSGEDADISK